MDFGTGNTLDLGSSFDVSTLVILVDDPNSTEVPFVTNLSLTVTTAMLLEPTTATLSLSALTGFATRRRQ